MTGREVILSIVAAFSTGALVASCLPMADAQSPNDTASVQVADAQTPTVAAAGDGQGRVFMIEHDHLGTSFFHCQKGECQQIRPKYLPSP